MFGVFESPTFALDFSSVSITQASVLAVFKSNQNGYGFRISRGSLELQPLTIGSLTMHTPVIQAALSGFSDRPMRAVARRYGAEFTMAEVVLDEHVVLKGKLRARLFEIADNDHPIGGQLMGSRPEQFAEAANDLVEAGYDSVDLTAVPSERCSAVAAAGSC